MSEVNDLQYLVVVNDEGQYSIWRKDKVLLPPGWSAEGFSGNETDCLAHIEKVWTDMTPKSLRTTTASH